MDVSRQYADSGYVKVPDFLEPQQLQAYRVIVEDFHQQWLKSHTDYYQDGAVNSAFVTTSDTLSPSLEPLKRSALFELIASNKLTNIVRPLFKHGFQFMNSQVFFDPKYPERKNYWHRDGQYHLSLEQQQAALADTTILHCRIALRDEAGIELVPQSHVQWDTAEELAVRLEQENCKNFDDLSSAEAIPLQAGDLLIFSANMLHRGLYGGDRLALDIIYCDDSEDLLAFRREDCIPEPEMADQYDVPAVFGF